MIAKLQSIAYTKNVLAYCERGGELIATKGCIGNSNQIYNQMSNNNRFNDRCLKNTFHISIRISPEDKSKLNTQDWLDIANKYAKKIGFENNPFAVYIHEENTEKEHIHIVASRIKANNTAVDDSYTHYKNMDFCREIEKKYRLRQVKRVLETVKDNKQFINDDKRMEQIGIKIQESLNQSDSMEDFVFHLKNMGVKVTIGRGIRFTDEKGVSFKGSKIGREYSLSGIKKQLAFENQNEEIKQKSKGFKYGQAFSGEVNLTNELERKKLKDEAIKKTREANFTVLKQKPKSFGEYTKKMKDLGIEIMTITDKQRNIQGFMFIHEETQTKLKPSDVHNSLNFNRLFKLEDNLNIAELNPGKIQSKSTFDLEGLLKSFSEIFEDGHSNDNKKKKRKRLQRRM